MNTVFDPILHTPPHAQKREMIAQYMRFLYHHNLLVAEGIRADTQAPKPPSAVPAELVKECSAAARMLAQAVRNKYTLSWDAQRYADHLGGSSTIKPNVEDELAETFPPLPLTPGVDPKPDQYGIIGEPAVITDCHGNILVWSLPRILSERRQATLLAATRHLEGHLRMETDDHIKSPGQQWRVSTRFFTTGMDWKSGSICFSPAWLTQGHKARLTRSAACRDANCILTPQTDNDHPLGTRILKESDGISWMAAWLESAGLLDGILAITHPALYRAAAEVQMRLNACAPALREQIARWPTNFNCIQLIVNRMTIHHRDTSGRPGWFDMLLSLGTYGETAVMQFCNLGAAVPYDTGSLVMVASRVVIHAVPEVPPDRICYSFFMVDSVHNWVRVADPGWSKHSDRINLKAVN